MKSRTAALVVAAVLAGAFPAGAQNAADADWGAPPPAPSSGPQWGPPPGTAAPKAAAPAAPPRTTAAPVAAQPAAPAPAWGPPPGAPAAGPQWGPPGGAPSGGGTQSGNQVLSTPGQNPCEKDIVSLRQAIERDGNIVKTSIQKKADRTIVCGNLKKFAVTEAKFVTFLTKNQQWCGVPPQIIDQLKKNHGHTLKLRGQACATGPAQAQRPQGSGLSEALGTTRAIGPSAGSAGNAGAFGTLSGNALAR